MKPKALMYAALSLGSVWAGFFIAHLIGEEQHWSMLPLHLTTMILFLGFLTFTVKEVVSE